MFDFPVCIQPRPSPDLAGTKGSGASVANKLLLENGTDLLLEDGTAILLE
jgi:hypothetical protein